MSDDAKKEPISANPFCRIIPETIRKNLGLCEWRADQKRIDPQYSQHKKYGEIISDYAKLKEHFLSLRDIGKQTDALEYTQYCYEQEEKRQNTVESKATVLAGFSATTATLVVTLLLALLGSENPPILDASLLRIIYVLGGLTLVLLIASILFAIRSISVRAYVHPQTQEVLGLAEKSLAHVKMVRATDYFDSFVKNQRINDIKVESLKYAVRCFRIAVLFMLAFTLLAPINGASLDPSNLPSSGGATQTAILTTPSTSLISPTPVTPVGTNTSQPIIAVTPPIPSQPIQQPTSQP